MDVSEKFETHSFEQKIECGHSRVPRCVDCVHIFLVSDLIDKIDQDTGLGIELVRTR